MFSPPSTACAVLLTNSRNLGAKDPARNSCLVWGANASRRGSVGSCLSLSDSSRSNRSGSPNLGGHPGPGQPKSKTYLEPAPNPLSQKLNYIPTVSNPAYLKTFRKRCQEKKKLSARRADVLRESFPAPCLLARPGGFNPPIVSCSPSTR